MGQQSAKKAAKAKHKMTPYQAKVARWVAGFAIFFVLLILAGLAVANDWFEGNGPACVVGDVEISKSEYRFNFHSNYATFVNYYSSMLSYIGLDTSTSLSEQNYDDDTTWEEYFDEQTYKSLADTVAMSEKAKENNVSLNEDNLAEIDDYIADVKAGAKENSMTFGGYTKNVFGRKLSEKEIRSALERMLLADQYAEELYDSYSISDDEIQSTYDADPAAYDTAHYRMVSIAADIPDQETTEDDEYEELTQEAMDVAEATAEALVSDIKENGGDEDAFTEAAVEYLNSIKEEDDEDVTAEDIYYTAVGSGEVEDTEGAEWIFDTDRKAGDITIIEGTEGYEVYFFIDRALDDYKVVNVRHILVPFNEDGEEAQSTAEDTEAKMGAEELKTTFEANGKTEEAFIELAKEKGTDSTAEDGGLLEEVVRGQSVEGFDEWLFDTEHEAGDYDIVKTTYGYHLVYFVSYGTEAWKKTIDEELRQDLYSADYDSIMANYSVTVSGNTVYTYSSEEDSES